jgi:hypothetical protein
MSYNGSGVWSANSTGLPVVSGSVISSTMFTALLADIATSFTTAYCKDGQSTPTANLPLGGFKLTGVGQATTSGDALAWGQGANVTSLTVGSLAGVLKGTAGVISAATAGTDYVAPGTATTFTAKQTFTGAAGVIGVKLVSALEKVTVSATVATGTINFDLTTQSNLYYTSNASANWTVNFRGDGSNSLDSIMATGEGITAVFRVTQGGTAFFNNAVTIDGSAVTPKWLGGAPTAGNISGVDSYTYQIIKTGAATFTVFASVAPFS